MGQMVHLPLVLALSLLVPVELKVVEQALVTPQVLLAPVLMCSLEQSVRLGGLLLLQSWRLGVGLVVHLPRVLALSVLVPVGRCSYRGGLWVMEWLCNGLVSIMVHLWSLIPALVML